MCIRLCISQSKINGKFEDNQSVNKIGSKFRQDCSKIALQLSSETQTLPGSKFHLPRAFAIDVAAPDSSSLDQPSFQERGGTSVATADIWEGENTLATAVAVLTKTSVKRIFWLAFLDSSCNHGHLRWLIHVIMCFCNNHAGPKSQLWIRVFAFMLFLKLVKILSSSSSRSSAFVFLCFLEFFFFLCLDRRPSSSDDSHSLSGGCFPSHQSEIRCLPSK